jgi:hypothetical protein
MRRVLPDCYQACGSPRTAASVQAAASGMSVRSRCGFAGNTVEVPAAELSAGRQPSRARLSHCSTSCAWKASYAA